jgi:hypothetical protein
MAATAAQFDIRLKRAYAPRSASDGTRILIDRCCAVLIVLAPGITSGHGYLDGRGGPVHARNRCRRRHRALRSL